MDQQKTILKISLAYLNLLGFSPYNNLRMIQVMCTISSYLIIFTLIYLRLFYEEITFNLISDTFESSFTMLHVLSKVTILVFKHDTFKHLLLRTERFLYSANLGAKFEENLTKELRFLKTLVTTFTAFVATTATVFALRPIFGDSLAITCYIPNQIPKSVFTVFNNLVFYVVAFSVGSFDMFVGSMVILIYLQFKSLNEIIFQLNLDRVRSKMDEKMRLEKMSMCVNYHNFLFEVLEELGSLVSLVFFIHFTLAPITLCFELFFLFTTSKLMEIAKSCFYLLGITSELVIFYCIPATWLTTESERMINVIYDSGWHCCQSAVIRKNIVIMMQRMQKPATLMAGKMFAVNLTTCTQIFKMSLSFYTFLRMLDDRSRQNKAGI